MSELTICNYCSLENMKRVAKQRGVEVILGKDEEGWVTARYSDDTKPTAYFMKLTKECAC